MANLVAALDPPLVVVGGGVSAAGDLLLDPARAALASGAWWVAGIVTSRGWSARGWVRSPV